MGPPGILNGICDDQAGIMQVWGDFPFFIFFHLRNRLQGVNLWTTLTMRADGDNSMLRPSSPKKKGRETWKYSQVSVFPTEISESESD
jgi:hypothetical protein